VVPAGKPRVMCNPWLVVCCYQCGVKGRVCTSPSIITAVSQFLNLPQDGGVSVVIMAAQRQHPLVCVCPFRHLGFHACKCPSDRRHEDLQGDGNGDP